ncbi:MAG: sigma-70 family RNA polymerase sigma factor [Oscillospiraceae bacterium]|nr:sigma-70 family RNA polymerase sigma factor [Oscillospiraceae bacterium]
MLFKIPYELRNEDKQGITYGELRKALPSSSPDRVPSAKELKNAARVILRGETSAGFLEVYDNGYFTYREENNITVCGVDRCTVLTWPSCAGKPSCLKGAAVDALPWKLPLMMVGNDRIEDSRDSMERQKQALYLDDPASTNNILFSTQPEHEIAEEELQCLKIRKEKTVLLRSAMKQLTERQREILCLIHLKHLTQKQVAEMLGISRSSVQVQLRAAEKKIRNYFKNTHHFQP